MSQFSCFVSSPLNFKSLQLVLATIKAGGIPILSTEFLDDNDLDLAWENLVNIKNIISKSVNISLNLSAKKINDFLSLINIFNEENQWLILSDWENLYLEEILPLTSPSNNRKILLQINNLKQLESLQKQNIKINGLIAKGCESGGFIGEDSAFILTQKLIKNTTLPVYIQGGISQNTASACRAIGVKGVILNEELLLMPESYFPNSWQTYLKNLTGQETITIGENINKPIRVLKRPQFTPVNELEKIADLVEVNNNIDQWETAINDLVGWDEPQVKAWAIGQGIGLAQQIRDKYHTTGRYIQAIINDTRRNIELSQQYQPLGLNSPLAQAHNTKYPFVQGPMTRVSDRSAFAEEVANGGGLPLIALALMTGKQVEELLTETKQLLGQKSWGIGILGFVPQEVRQEQLAVVKKIKPPFALIAGGRPDQAIELEQEGITTYLHVPNLPLLKMFVEQGARHFVLEGRECGGHIGPLSSFVLWSSAIDFLLTLPSNIQQEIHILFAGGIHDEISGAMISVMASPLAEVGIKIGVLMGSAYLFTEEAVNSGAILPQFQQTAIQCNVTKNLQTSPGHASRCADTPFVQEFFETRRRMLAENKTPDEIKNTLEDMTLGRLRVATKGILREGSELKTVDENQQLNQGMYMIGQVATMRNQPTTITQLHQQVSEGSTNLVNNIILESNPSLLPIHYPLPKPLDIAIIGISTLLPSADNPEKFWDNILHGVNCLTEIPASRWDWRLYYSGDRTERDKIYSKWGGFLEDLPFEPLNFGIPPKSLKSIEPMQLLALEAVRRALLDAGTAYEKGDFPREETAVILGASGGMGDLGVQYATRSELPKIVANPEGETYDRLAEWTEESFAGLLMNVISGRVANRFDLGGSNFTVDAACASSLTAIDMAVQQLVTGKAKIAIAGGVDAIQSPFGYFCFSKTQALSPTGVVKSFDKSADGIVISEGVGMVVLKPLEDAEKDGDRIYAIIKGIGSSSDGKGLSLTAPASSGQKRAFLRAYQQAGFSPSTLGLYEAHGTGTVAGDKAELTTISELLKEENANPKSCVLGSVKTMIGHTKSTAGVAGLIKVALGLHYQVLPNHLNVENPLPEIEDENSPLYLLKNPKPWLANPDYPRRGAVSAFGFGGTNFHVVLEEYNPEFTIKNLEFRIDDKELDINNDSEKEAIKKSNDELEKSIYIDNYDKKTSQSPQHPNTLTPHSPFSVTEKIYGASNWHYELIVIGGESLNQLRDKITNLYSVLKQQEKLTIKLKDLAYSYALDCQPLTKNLYTATITVKNLEELKESLAEILDNFDNQADNDQLNPNIQLNLTGKALEGKIAFLFPGQVSQYPNMGLGLTLFFPEMREAIEKATCQLKEKLPKLLNQYIFPPSPYTETDKEKSRLEISQTHIAQSCLAAIELGYLKILQRLNLQPDLIAGHSYGEYGALMASGVISPEDFITLSEARGKVMQIACENSEGAMAVVKATRQKVNQLINDIEGVEIANHNAPLQVVISGKKEAVNKAVERMEKEEITVKMLAVTGAFHSTLMDSAQKTLNQKINETKMNSPQVPVYSNITAQPYPDNEREIKNLLSQHLLSKVEFVEQIKKMYGDGGRIFIEVGSKNILSNLTSRILHKEIHSIVTIPLDGHDHRSDRGLNGFLSALGILISHGVKFDLLALFNNRDCQKLNLNRLQDYQTKLPVNAWLLNGGSIRKPEEKVGYTGKIPPLNLETSQQTKLKAIKKETSPISVAENVNNSNQPKFLSNGRQNEPINDTLNKNQLSSPNQTKINPISANSTAMNQHQPQLINSTDLRLSAYQSYQETMRQFLQVQENVMKAFLTGNSNNNHQNNLIKPLQNQSLPPAITSPVNNFSTISQQNGQNGNTNLLQSLPNQVNQSQPLESTTVVNSPVINDNYQTSQITTQTAVIPNPNNQEITRSSLIEIIVNLVSERTGYPEEMLGLEQDLEAELGIDSIKRVEIFGALQKTLPEKYANQIKAQMEEITKAKTLKKLADLILDSNSINNGNNNQNSTSQNQEINQEYLTKTLLNLVSERTGYPEEMLGLEQDLEAELGIDSIKRVEILGALPKILPTEFADKIKGEMENLTKVKTLNNLINLLLNL